MKKIVLLLLLIMPIFVQAKTKYLYDILKEEAENGGVAREYVGEHQDTYDDSGTEKIYHFYSTSASDAAAIKNMRNVLFAGYCWEMFRTTDSGGVKLLYNGIPTDDGKCYGTQFDIGKANFVHYDNIYTLGALGYMNNEIYHTWGWKKPSSYGSFSQSGTKILAEDYILLSNNSGIPFTFSSDNTWKSGSYTNQDSRGSYTFKVRESGNYIFDFIFRPSRSTDYLNIYINDVFVNKIQGSSSSVSALIPFDNLSSSDVIRFDFSLYGSSTNGTMLTYSLKKPTGAKVDTRPYFGNDVKYSNGVFTLVDTIRVDPYTVISNHRYYCLNGSTSCSEVYYTTESVACNDMSSYQLSGSFAKNIEEYVYNQLYADDVNKNDSPLKKTIDNWYQNNIIDYQQYLEDTVFCQKRNLPFEDSVFNPDGGLKSAKFYLETLYSDSDEVKAEKYAYNSNLKCINETDRFSINNEKAKLKYPVATINLAEELLLSPTFYSYNGGEVRSFSEDISGYHTYWLLSPNNMGSSIYGFSIQSSGNAIYSYGSNNISVRPVVSLRKGIKYLDGGDGSSTNPYVASNLFSIGIEAVDETKDLNMDIDDFTQVEYEKEVTFKVTPIKGYQVNSIRIVDEDNHEIEFEETGNKNEYSFVMPASDVTIIPSYEKVKSSVEVEENSHTKMIVIEVEDAKAVVYEDTVKFTITPADGYEIDTIIIADSEGNNVEYRKTKNENEYEFLMPDMDVIITPIYREIEKDNNVVNPKTGNKLFIMLSILIFSVSAVLLVHKKRI